MFIIALIVFLGFYNQCYKEADLLSEYKVVLPGWMMQIFSFPAKVCKKVPLLNRLMPKERVYDMSIYNVTMLTYAMISVITTSVFYLLEDDFIVSGAWFCIWLFVATIMFIISVLCDICFKRKNMPLKVFLVVLGIFGAFLMFGLCVEAAKDLPVYVWSTLFGTVAAYVAIFKVSFVEPVDGKYIKYTFEDGLLKIDCGKRKIDIPLEKITRIVISGRILFFEDENELVSMPLNGEEIGVAQELVENYYCRQYEMDMEGVENWRKIDYSQFEDEVKQKEKIMHEKLLEHREKADFEINGNMEYPYKYWAGYHITGHKDGVPVSVYIGTEKMEWSAGTAVVAPLIFSKDTSECVLLINDECGKYMDEQLDVGIEIAMENSYEKNACRNKYSKWMIPIILLQIIMFFAEFIAKSLVIKVLVIAGIVSIWWVMSCALKKDLWHVGIKAMLIYLFNMVLTLSCVLMLI